jgi:flavin reductase (DIM6/NTAB) family NADH-FMN oxidoreductase RutF
MNITEETIAGWEQNYRRSFINSLAGFRQVALIGTYNKSGMSNLAIFNSLVHLGANPALYGLISRPDTVPRDTYTNIVETGEYSINYVRSIDADRAHQTSARYEHNVSEFDVVGFDEQKIAPYNAPFIADAIVKIAMKFETKIDIKINGTIMIIGSLQYIHIDKKIVREDGMVDLCAADTLISSGLDAYYSSNLIARYGYAKPDTWPIKKK